MRSAITGRRAAGRCPSTYRYTYLDVPVESRDDADWGAVDGEHYRCVAVRDDGEVYGWRETAGAYRTRLTDTEVGRRALAMAARG